MSCQSVYSVSAVADGEVDKGAVLTPPFFSVQISLVSQAGWSPNTQGWVLNSPVCLTIRLVRERYHRKIGAAWLTNLRNSPRSSITYIGMLCTIQSIVMHAPSMYTIRHTNTLLLLSRPQQFNVVRIVNYARELSWTDNPVMYRSCDDAYSYLIVLSFHKIVEARHANM